MENYDDEIKMLESIRVLKDTEGMGAIRDFANKAVVVAVNQLSNSRGKTYEELLELCAHLNANLNVYQLLTQIDERIEAVKEIMK